MLSTISNIDILQGVIEAMNLGRTKYVRNCVIMVSV